MDTRVKTSLNVLATCSIFLRFFQYDEKEAYENFKQFYEDTLPEFRKAGTVVQFKVTLILPCLLVNVLKKIQ